MDPFRGLPRNGSNYALQDYQMQLMLLEQQNKKRKLAEQKNHQHYQSPHPVVKVPSEDEDVVIVSVGQKKQLSNGQKAQPNDRHGTRSNEDCDANSAEEIVPERELPHFDTVYEVQCSRPRCSHSAPAFRDVPLLDSPKGESSRNRTSRASLNGKIPVPSLEAFMEDDAGETDFVVIRTVECSEASVLMARADGPILGTEAIYVKSKRAKDALREIATCYFHPISKEITGSGESQSLHKTRTFDQNRISPADLFLFHHRHVLKSHAMEQPESRRHIEALLEYTGKRFGKEFAEADSLLANGWINQEHISKLFRPNEIVVAATDGQPRAYILQEWPEVDCDGGVALSCWSLQPDGSGFARKRSVLSISRIDQNFIRIQDLAVYPLGFAAPELRDMIRNRGKKHWELRSPIQITYNGWSVDKDEFIHDTRFMIDYKAYRKMHKKSPAFRFEKPITIYPFDRMPVHLNSEQVPSDLCFFIMPPEIYGFNLMEKKWMNLFVGCIYPVAWNKTAYERLVLPPQTKELIWALITARASQRGIEQGFGAAIQRTEITCGKRKGLTILLHGGPGTGKTLTAESVAEILEMPLYRVTCGDLGRSTEALENSLEMVLHLGKAWNCVLLLDELDVFLEERSMDNLKRNSLLSVLLRILEHYDGILILTSHRVSIFDEACKSRIQVALPYENLNRLFRREIWHNLLETLQQEDGNVNFGEIILRLDDLAGRELNGHQICNALATAKLLAISRVQRLDWEHLEQALSVVGPQ